MKVEGSIPYKQAYISFSVLVALECILDNTYNYLIYTIRKNRNFM